MRFVVTLDNWGSCRFEIIWQGRSFPSVSANCQTWKIRWWWHQTQCLVKCFPKRTTIVDLKTVFKIIGCWKEDRSSKLGSVSVWCGLARSLLPMVLRHPIAKCQALKIAWWWHKSKLSWLLSKRTVPNNVAMKTVCHIIGCFKGDTSSRCQSDAAWQGHSFRWFWKTLSPNVRVWKWFGRARERYLWTIEGTAASK